MRWWKVLGMAGVVGVAATGAVVARAERRRRAYTPEQVRERLHARYDQVAAASESAASSASSAASSPSTSGSKADADGSRPSGGESQRAGRARAALRGLRRLPRRRSRREAR